MRRFNEMFGGTHRAPARRSTVRIFSSLTTSCPSSQCKTSSATGIGRPVGYQWASHAVGGDFQQRPTANNRNLLSSFALGVGGTAMAAGAAGVLLQPLRRRPRGLSSAAFCCLVVATVFLVVVVAVGQDEFLSGGSASVLPCHLGSVSVLAAGCVRPPRVVVEASLAVCLESIGEPPGGSGR